MTPKIVPRLKLVISDMNVYLCSFTKVQFEFLIHSVAKEGEEKYFLLEKKLTRFALIRETIKEWTTR